MSTLVQKTFELLRPKHIHCLNHHPSIKCVYVGPTYNPWMQDSKWFQRTVCFCVSEDKRFRGADIPLCVCGRCIPFYHFNHKKYEDYIVRFMWDQLPELYGKFITCGCYGFHCQCQAEVLRSIVEKRIKKDFKNVDEKQFQELRAMYELNNEDLDLWMMNFEQYERDYALHKEKYEQYIETVINSVQYT